MMCQIQLLIPEPQRCEVDHVLSCDFTRVCSFPSGQIASLDYPVPYPQRTSCSWRIITNAGTFILMSFLDFDIPSLGDCSSSSLAVYNGGFEVDDSRIGLFCNSRRPPLMTASAFNHLFVVLNTGAEEPGMGFVAEYSESRRQLNIDVPTNASGKVLTTLPVTSVPGTGYCSFTSSMRTHHITPAISRVNTRPWLLFLAQQHAHSSLIIVSRRIFYNSCYISSQC